MAARIRLAASVPNASRRARVFVVRYVVSESTKEPYVFAECPDVEAAAIVSGDLGGQVLRFGEMLAYNDLRAALEAWYLGDDSRRRRSLEKLRLIRSPEWHFGG
jgi:hypothetical protein